MRKYDIPLLIVASGLIATAIVWFGDPILLIFLLLYGAFHGACFMVGRAFNFVWLRVAPAGLATAGLLVYLLHGATLALRGHVLTVIYAIFAIILVIATLFSLALSVVLERIVPAKNGSNRSIHDRD